MHQVLDQDGLRIVFPDDCGNAPKKMLLRDFNIAFARDDVAFILDNLDEEICWNMVGDRRIEGIEKVKEVLHQMTNGPRVKELHLHNIITHGKTGAANGILIFESGKQISFCDVYRFSSAGKNAKISEMTSYVIAI